MGINFIIVVRNKAMAFLFIPLFWILFIIVTIFTFLFRILQLNTLRRILRKGRKISVLFLEVVPKDNAGYLYRSQKWQNILKQNGINSRVYTVVTQEKNFNKLQNATYLIPIFFLVFICKRFIQCCVAFNYDVVIVRRELLIFNDYGNLFMEIFLRCINNKIILDFDDDISDAKHEPRKISLYGKILIEVPDKFIQTLNFYNYFTPGSNYLKERILLHNPLCNEDNISVPAVSFRLAP